MVPTNHNISYLWNILKIPCQEDPYLGVPKSGPGNMKCNLLSNIYIEQRKWREIGEYGQCAHSNCLN